MAGNTANSFNIELLNSNNYHTWKYRMSVLLEEKEVIDYIEVEFKEENYREEREKKEAKRKDNRCKSYIVQCVGDSQVDLVRDCKTAYSMWKNLEDRYEKKGIPGQLVLRKKLMSMKMKEDDDLEIFFANFEEVIRQLKAAGADCKEEDIVCTLLLAMPKSFETVLTILENVPPTDLTLNLVQAKLRSEIERRQAQNPRQNPNAKTRFELEKPAVFTGKMVNVNCHFCGEKGHFKRDCQKFVQQYGGGSRIFQGGYVRGRGNYNNVNPTQEIFRGRGSFRGTRGYGFTENRRGSRGGFGTSYQGNRGGAGTSYQGSRGSNYGQFTNMERRGYSVQNEDESEDKDGICFLSDIDECKNQVYNVSTDLLFCVDSGCTDHLVNDKNYFSELLMLNKPIQIAVAKSNNFMEAIGVGNIKAISNVRGKEIVCSIKNVFYVPNLRRNLLSVKRLEMSNIEVLFSKGQVSLYHENVLIGEGHRNNLYEIYFGTIKSESLFLESENYIANLWHKRYGHICQSYFEKLIKNKLVEGINDVKLGKIEFCEACVQGKMNRSSFGTRSKASRILEIVHSDVAGPMTPASYDDCKYFVTFIDDYSNFVHVYIIKNKSEVFDCFKEYCLMVQSKFNSKISILRTDNGGEYISKDFRNFCRGNGTVLDYTIKYTPEQNGKAERYNRSLVEKARSMTYEAGMPKIFWNEAIRVAAYLMNRSPSANLDNVTPAQIWYDKKPNVENLRVFGSMAYAHIPVQLRTKLDKKSETYMIGI